MTGARSEGVSSTKNFYIQARMSKMASGALFFPTDRINTPFKKYIKSSLRIFLSVISVTFDESFEPSKKIFNRVQKVGNH